MNSTEILKKVRKIEIVTRRLVNDVFAGEYHSIFKGEGIEFSEVRQYNIGDDIRTIDWNVSARMGTLYVKKYVEERELTVMLLIDMSSSSKFGTTTQLKSEIAAEISALLAFSAIKNNDKVGMIIFTDKIEKYIPPKKGRSHTLRLIREILSFKPEHNKTDLNIALEYLNKVIKRKAIVFLISDFISPDYSKSISIANKKHDLIAITLTDKAEKEIKGNGFLYLEDAETGEEAIVEVNNPFFQNRFKKTINNELLKRKKLFQSINLDNVEIGTESNYYKPLIAFFKERMKKI